MTKKMYVLTLMCLSLTSLQTHAGFRERIVTTFMNLLAPYTAMQRNLSSTITKLAAQGPLLPARRASLLVQHKQGQAIAYWLRRASQQY